MAVFANEITVFVRITDHPVALGGVSGRNEELGAVERFGDSAGRVVGGVFENFGGSARFFDAATVLGAFVVTDAFFEAVEVERGAADRLNDRRVLRLRHSERVVGVITGNNSPNYVAVRVVVEAAGHLPNRREVRFRRFLRFDDETGVLREDFGEFSERVGVVGAVDNGNVKLFRAFRF